MLLWFLLVIRHNVQFSRNVRASRRTESSQTKLIFIHILTFIFGHLFNAPMKREEILVKSLERLLFFLNYSVGRSGSVDEGKRNRVFVFRETDVFSRPVWGVLEGFGRGGLLAGLPVEFFLMKKLGFHVY